MKKTNLKWMLKNHLSNDELMLVPGSFDIIGSREKAVAIIEIPEKLKPHKELIAKALMQLHKNVKTVLNKGSKRRGVLRLRDYDLIFGERDTEVIHKEHGCTYKVDPQKVYFSPREGTERIKIASQVSPEEVVLVMFSGVGPFPILIAKKQPKVKKVYAIELNSIAHDYCVNNVQQNKLVNKVFPILGDVSEVCPKLIGQFDRVLMPLPKEAYRFLDIAIPCLKDSGILHFYYWAHENNLFSKAEELLVNIAIKLGVKIDIMNKIKVLKYGPRKWKIRLDVALQSIRLTSEIEGNKKSK